VQRGFGSAIGSEVDQNQSGVVPKLHVDLDLAVDLNDDATERSIRRVHTDRGEQNEHVFGIEKLDVYQRSVELVVTAARIIRSCRAGTRRCRRHYAIALGSAMECAAILDAPSVNVASPDSLAAAERSYGC
jgi:hypothetical protein